MKPTRLALVLVPLLALAGVAGAHYPMLITPRPMVSPREPITVEYTNGHPFMNDRFPAPQPTRVRVYRPNSRHRTLTTKVEKIGTEKLPRWRVRYTPKKSGDYIFSWHCGVFHEPPQRQVADYAKLVIHVRDEGGAQVGWRRVVGDPLEIVPLTRPYAIPVGTAFRGRVVFNSPQPPDSFKSMPLPEAVVEAETYAPGKKPGKSYLPNSRLGVQTDDQGYFSVTLPRAGWWLISVATDGGPGEQGLSKMIARRAVLWVYVGGTVFDAQATSTGPTSVPAKKKDRRNGMRIPEEPGLLEKRAGLGWLGAVLLLLVLRVAVGKTKT